MLTVDDSSFSLSSLLPGSVGPSLGADAPRGVVTLLVVDTLSGATL